MVTAAALAIAIGDPAATTGMAQAQTAVVPPAPEVPGYHRTKLGAFDVIAISDGLRDQPVPARYAKRLAHDIRTADLVLLEAGHWFPLRQPDRVAAKLDDFWLG